MAKLCDIEQADWEAWVATRPPVVQELCKRLPPNYLYRMKSTGHRVTMFSYSENGTVSVLVTGQFNCVVFERRVFGVNPDDLEECDLPGPDEVLGTVLANVDDEPPGLMH